MNLTVVRGNLSGRLIKPLIPALIRSRIKPNTLTVIGLLINVAAAGAVTFQYFLLGGLLLLLSGLFDMLDGAVARAMRQTSSFGALLDSFVDRLTEALLLIALVIVYLGEPAPLMVVLAFTALTGSFLTSYIRARAEGLGLDCKTGFFTRAERVVVMSLGLILNQMLIGLIVLSAMAFFTVGQRLVHVYRRAGREGKPLD